MIKIIMRKSLKTDKIRVIGKEDLERINRNLEEKKEQEKPKAKKLTEAEIWAEELLKIKEEEE